MRYIMALLVVSSLGCATEDYVDAKVKQAKDAAFEQMDTTKMDLHRKIDHEVTDAKAEIMTEFVAYSTATTVALDNAEGKFDTIERGVNDNSRALEKHADALGPLLDESLTGMTEEQQRDYIRKKAREGGWPLGSTIEALYRNDEHVANVLKDTGLSALADANLDVASSTTVQRLEDRVTSAENHLRDKVGESQLKTRLEEYRREADGKFLSATEASGRFAAQATVLELSGKVNTTESHLHTHIRESDERFAAALAESSKALARFRIYPPTNVGTSGKYEVQLVEDLHYAGTNIRPEGYTSEKRGGPQYYRWNLTTHDLEAKMHRRLVFRNGCWQADTQWVVVGREGNWLVFPSGFEVYEERIYAPGFPLPRRGLTRQLDIPPLPDP